MSFGGAPGESLLGPLLGRTTTFLVDGRNANIRFARALACATAKASLTCAVFDLDALYSSNSDLVFKGLTGDHEAFSLSVPAPGSDIEADFVSLLAAEQKVMVIDSLNTLYHLISGGAASSRGRKLTFALASLSHLARSNNKIVVLSMYRREALAKQRRGRSISDLSDITASVDLKGDSLEVTTVRGEAWEGGRFSSRIP